ncbi:hypothetical protein FLAG1_10661 [Fusarium langsethiae]|uniref:Uncharacterized protein n=1 Tax=Fusarium langsethiae TaxID=179993 RepID=A0A0N0DBB8_FUSLA|nr:hypothetical protein FLAG1_10661 [Fusarium langsethiae]GKU06742.1 unnamed protein product [Fusarium langsethiae]GKU22637.1 unnamed protein product [Fusarium langsethiae]
MRPFLVAWALFTVAASLPFLEDFHKTLRYWLLIDWPRDTVWEPFDGPMSPGKLEMEWNGTLRGPKVFIPNPSFELNMGKPWKLVGDGVEVVNNISLSRRGNNSLLFTISDPEQLPSVYSVHLKSLRGHQVYYLKFNYRLVKLKGITKKRPCFIIIGLGDMVVTYSIFVKPGDRQMMYHGHLRYQSVTVPMYSRVSVSPLVISMFCGENLHTGDYATVSIDDIRLEKGEGVFSDWAFDLPRPQYRYGLRDGYIADFQHQGAKWYFYGTRTNMPVSCRKWDWDCYVAGGDYRRQDIWDEGLGDYWPNEHQPAREVSEVR